MKRETPNQKLRRELLDVKRKLFKVCTDRDSKEAQDIIFEQKVLKTYTLMPERPYYDKLKELGLGRMPEKPFEHYETERK